MRGRGMGPGGGMGPMGMAAPDEGDDEWDDEE
jgi:hypothetical protein